MPSESTIKTVEVTKIYDTGKVKVPALNGINLEIHDGEFVALMGASGSGKSTLMNLLGCLDRPTAGKYLFCGDDVSNLSRDRLAEIRNARLGFVFQGFNLLSRTTALDNVQLPLMYNSRVSARQRLSRAKELLERVGLAQRMDHHPNELSGGQQQRVAIARALVNHPQVLLADEPTGNLDSKTGLEILAEFQRLNAQEGQTIVIVTHDPHIANCCLRQIVMQDGEIVSDRMTEERRDAGSELQQLRSHRPHLSLEVAS